MVSYVAKPEKISLTFYVERKKVAGKAASADISIAILWLT